MRDGFAVRAEAMPCDPVGAILFSADLEDVDLISMGVRCSGLRHAFMESVAEMVLRQADRPILLTGAMAAPMQQPAPYRRTLVALDSTPRAEAALSYLARERIGDEADLILLQVVAPAIPPYGPYVLDDVADQVHDEADRATQRRLREAAAYLQATGATLRRKGAWSAHVTVGAARSGILAVATATDVDLIVLVSHSRQGLDRLVQPSAALQAARQAEAHVLVLPRRWARAPLPAEHSASSATT